MTNSETITILKDYLGLRNDVKLAPKLDEAVSMAIDALQESESVSYTHLDVYKRQRYSLLSAV